MLVGPFNGVQAVADGLVTSKELRNTHRYRRILRNVYAPVEVEWDFATRTAAACVLARERRGVLVGYSAALLLGADCAPSAAPAEMQLATGSRHWPGLRVTQGRIEFDDIVYLEGDQLTSPGRTVWDLARRGSLEDAVVATDALARATGVKPDELLRRRDLNPGARGCRRLDEVVRLADPRAESPRETRVRLALVLAGLPAPEVQYEVIDEWGRPVARLDLAYPARRVAIEYDGAVHFDEVKARSDRQRDAILAGYGWQTVRLTSADLGSALPITVGRIRRLLAARALFPSPKPT
jgi:hypothetical protein